MLASVLAGLLFGTVFGPVALLAPLLVVGVAALLVAELCRRRSGFAPWRPVLVVVAGLLGIALWSTTAAGLPTEEMFRALAGVTDSWRLTLESTWPARPDPELLLFVPFAVLIACALGLEIRERWAAPLPALLPPIAVVVLSQMYDAVDGTTATVAALGLAVLAAGLVLTSRTSVAASNSLPVLGAMGGAVLLGAVLLVTLDPAGRPAYTLKQDQTAPLPQARVLNPLSDIGRRLGEPGTEVFRYRSTAPVDRWRLVVLDRFDGVTWSSRAPYRTMGAELRPGLTVTAPTDRHSAQVEPRDVGGPWLPSQLWPSRVVGAGPLVDESGGVLMGQADSQPADYTLEWTTPRVTRDQLLKASIDPHVPDQLRDLDAVPDEIAALARQASGGRAPSFQTAVRLQEFLKSKYQTATGELPTGHGWPQLRTFLLDEKIGTSEQFAAAYVVLARLNGIPARVVVGFRAVPATDASGNHMVRNGQVLAWPEVALQGLGWWPLDPAGRSTDRSPAGSQADLTDEVTKELPPAEDEEAEVPPEEEQPAPPADTRASAPAWAGAVLVAVLVLAGLVLVALLAVPILRWARSQARRRRPGQSGVLAAWAEARDRLRAHGVPVSAAMTVRDLVHPAEPVGGRTAVVGIHRLAVAVDRAVWSGRTATEQLVIEAWAAVHELRRGLRGQPLPTRLRATFNPRPLRPPR